MTPVLLINYSRSGGTLLNKCIGVLPNAVVLSEVHRDGGGWGVEKERSIVTVWDQAKKWYNIEITSRTFEGAVSELNEYCIRNRKHLIIREWSYLNFNKNDFYNNNPSHELSTLKELALLKPKAFAFVRNAIDVWLSSGKPEPNDFFRRYLKYVNEIINHDIRYFKYEHFVKDPIRLLKEICFHTGLEFDSNFLAQYQSFEKVNGDVQKGDKSRGIKQAEIKPLRRKNLSLGEIYALSHNTAMIEANFKLGYSNSYFDTWTLTRVKWLFYKPMRQIYAKLRQLNKQRHLSPAQRKWLNDKGDQRLRLNYNLNVDSFVIDLGGYEGKWSNEINERYKCSIYIFEPANSFYLNIEKRFSSNSKIKVFNFGLASKNASEKLFLQDNGSSTHTGSNKNNFEIIVLKEAATFFVENKIEKIDLMKINIEGGEYDLLEHLIDTGDIKKIDNIQIQFHDFVENAESRMKSIQEQLLKTHELTYQYPFVWENWKRKWDSQPLKNNKHL
jgi:FkbM family methyltransferase